MNTRHSILKAMRPFCLTLVLTSGMPAHAGESEPAAGSPHSLFLVVLQAPPSGAPELDVERTGGKVEFRSDTRMAIRIPEAAVEGLRHNPRVKYIQRVTPLPASPPAAQSQAVELPREANGTGSWTTGAYEYDGAGNITRIGPGTSQVTDSYTYDGLGRLTAATVHAGTTPRTESYEYDTFGNMTARTTNGTRITLPVNVANNRLNTGALTYDAVGNLTADAVQQLAYDPAGMVAVRERPGKRWHYLYTADEERLAVRNDLAMSWKWTVRDTDGKVLREFESFGGMEGASYWLWVQDHAYAGSRLLGGERPQEEGGKRHDHLDHLGTPRMITADDGQQISVHSYYPFGAESTSLGQYASRGFDREESMRFTSHERDFQGSTTVDNTDYLDYMHARYYNPNWGRFLSVDPVLNLKRALREPQNWNRYAYVMNNPLKYTDPTGKDVSIRLNFTGDGWTDEQKKQILAQVTQWYQKQNVGKVFVFDGAKQSHGRFLGNLLRGHTSLNVTSGTGTGAHKPGTVYAGNYFNDKSLSAAQATRATSNTIIHETAAHKFGATYLNGQDQLFYLRNIAIAQQDSALRARYGTVADSYAFDAADTRGNVTNGPIPIHPGDLRSLQQYLGPIHAEPPEDD